MSGSSIALMINLFSSFILIGIILWAQLITLTLFQEIPISTFKSLYHNHYRRTKLLAIPLMAIEIISSMIIILFPPEHIPRIPLLINFGLVVLIWLSSILIQSPIHQRLAFNPGMEDIRLLEKTNWIRTILWNLKGILLIWIVVEYQLFVATLRT